MHAHAHALRHGEMKLRRNCTCARARLDTGTGVCPCPRWPWSATYEVSRARCGLQQSTQSHSYGWPLSCPARHPRGRSTIVRYDWRQIWIVHALDRAGRCVGRTGSAQPRARPRGRYAYAAARRARARNCGLAALPHVRFRGARRCVPARWMLWGKRCGASDTDTLAVCGLCVLPPGCTPARPRARQLAASPSAALALSVVRMCL